MTLRSYLDEGLYFQIVFKYFLFAYSDVYIQARHVGRWVPPGCRCDYGKQEAR